MMRVGTGVRKDIMSGIRFCPRCDYAISELQIEHARIDYDCPRCNRVPISEFYRYGSSTHKARWEAWERGDLDVMGVIGTGAPLPFPEAGDE